MADQEKDQHRSRTFSRGINRDIDNRLGRTFRRLCERRVEHFVAGSKGRAAHDHVEPAREDAPQGNRQCEPEHAGCCHHG